MKSIEEMIAVMQHYANGGKVEFFGVDEWEYTKAPKWDWYGIDYRIAKPTTKVKLEAWLSPAGALVLCTENYQFGNAGPWKRVPSEDKEVEVEE